MNDRFADQIYAYVSKIPAGQVVTYGTIAKDLGRPLAARSVGTILKRNPNPFYKVKPDSLKARQHAPLVPCHRVVRGDRTLGGYSGCVMAKKRLLEREGVVIHGAKVAPEHLRPAILVHVQNALA